MRVRTAAFVIACLCMPALGHAQEQDVEGSKDHAMVSRFPGYYIDEYNAEDFGAYEFAVPGGESKRIEGRYWRISYVLKEGAKKGGAIELGRNYANTFTQHGGAKLLEEMDAGGGRLTARMPAEGRNIWLEVAVHDSGATYILTIVEEAALVQRVEFTAMELARQLNEKGSVALHGILFDTAKATIKAESKAALAAVGEVLTQNAALQIEIQGHTDNVGAAAANLKLSQDRAAAVKAYLVSTFSIVPARLTTAGFGDTRPTGDNKTEAGRAQNRRVELVKK